MLVFLAQIITLPWMFTSNPSSSLCEMNDNYRRPGEFENQELFQSFDRKNRFSQRISQSFDFYIENHQVADGTILVSWLIIMIKMGERSVTFSPILLLNDLTVKVGRFFAVLIFGVFP